MFFFFYVCVEEKVDEGNGKDEKKMHRLWKLTKRRRSMRVNSVSDLKVCDG